MHIDIADRHAVYKEAPATLVCGNPFHVIFSFDEEWDEFADRMKKAKIKFWHKGRYEHIIIEFMGNDLFVPALFGVKHIEIGVFIDDGISTTTGARIECEKSIRCGESIEVLGADAVDNINNALTEKSAYWSAVQHGFEGTEEEWLASLRGESPYIGENGNWWVGDTDTGVPVYETQELEYQLNEDKQSYTVVGIETHTDSTLIIPKFYKGHPVTSIGERAFEAYDSLTSVVIPNSVTSIGTYAFAQCLELCEVYIPKSVTSVGSEVFFYSNAKIYCEAISKPTGWKSDWDVIDYLYDDSRCDVVWGYVMDFDGVNEAIDKVNDDLNDLKNNMSTKEKAEKFAYYGDTDIVISDESLFKFTELDDGTYSIAAKNAWSLNGHIVLPYKYNGKLVTEIKGGGFASHNDNAPITTMTGLTIPRTIRAINNSAFARNNIPKITIPGSCKKIGTTAFYKCKMWKLVLEDGVEEIGENAFTGCDRVTFNVIPKTLKMLYSNSFAGAGQIKEVFYTGDSTSFYLDSIQISDKLYSLHTLLKDWIWQATIWYDYGNKEHIAQTASVMPRVLEQIIDEQNLKMSILKEALSKGMTIKEKILYSGQKFYIHPNSFYAAFPPTKNLALYYGDGRADDPYQNYKIGLIVGINSDVIDGKFRSGTIIQYDGSLLSMNTTAIYAYFQDNTNEVDGGVGAYIKWNGGSDTYCPILYSVPIEVE